MPGASEKKRSAHIYRGMRPHPRGSIAVRSYWTALGCLCRLSTRSKKTIKNNEYIQARQLSGSHRSQPLQDCSSLSLMRTSTIPLHYTPFDYSYLNPIQEPFPDSSGRSRTVGKVARPKVIPYRRSQFPCRTNVGDSS